VTGAPDMSLASRRVVVAGASGFVGRHVCAALVEAGAQIAGTTRAEPPDIRGMEWVQIADLFDRAALRPALRGAHAVVHLAARVHVLRERSADPLAAYRRVNVDGTAVLLEEARLAGVEQFVFVSSAKAVGEGGEHTYTEHTLPVPTSPYGRSKLEAERVVHAAGVTGQIAPTVLRLPLVYGPGVRANMQRLFQLVDRGIPLPFGLVENRRSLAYVGNVAAAIARVLERPARVAGRTFYVSDGVDLSTAELVRLIADALGRPARLVPIPPSWLRQLARIGDILAMVTPMPVTSAALSRLLGSLTVDSAPLAAATGYVPTTAPRDGIRRTAEWFQDWSVR
jgi:nucleoside-diphosphate-sugar epimerase